ncbi:hypothetical protein FNV43_RR16747 [Rhamnella rubrinervis]|uniref:Uncharacterized protein n=1 Tax=Rhamnella rubrinervis TaxID=2594499 RepID=A0A8K0GZC6_9ROSA|nr:hypothetical protein FNV43_RR16747 [Rhamnella rubrinervis]
MQLESMRRWSPTFGSKPGDQFGVVLVAYATARKVGFEVVKEKDLCKPSVKPWWLRLKMGKVAYWRNHMLVMVLAWFGIALKVL